MSAEEINASGWLSVDGETEVYWEERGDRRGQPLLYLHGGPGSGLSAHWFTTFDTGRHRLIGLDQRGCGRSRPLVSQAPESLATNTTAALICDIEVLRRHLGVETWIVSGISWGSTLALAYALEHPARVEALLLGAVTTTDRAEVDWLTEAIGRVFPEDWDHFATASGARRGERIVEAYARRLAAIGSASLRDRESAALAWDRWECAHMSLDRPQRRGEPLHTDSAARLVFATLVTHYWSHDAFLPGERAILARTQAGGLTGIPTTLIHGRRDIGPAVTPWRLHQAIPDSRLEILESLGHGGAEMWERMRRALD